MSRVPRLNRALGLAAPILLVIIAACSAPAPASPTAPPPTSAPATAAAAVIPTAAAPASVPTAAATAAPKPAAAPTAKPAPTGVLRVGAPEWGAEGFDPVVTPGAGGGNGLGPVEFVFDWLVGANQERKDLSTQTGLANKWETSPDGLTWTFYLRKGVTFDQAYGEATADDVKFSVERNIRQGSVTVASGPLRAAIKSIQVVDPYAVRFNLNYPLVTLAYDLSALTDAAGVVYPKKYLEKIEEKDFSTKPVGSGPYRLQSQQKGQSMTFEARDDYWGGTAKYKQVVFSVVPEEGTRAAMLKTGQLDVALMDISSLKDLDASGLKVTERVGASSVAAYFNDQWQGAFADVRVRQAISVAINKKELLGLFGGRGQVLGQGVWTTWAVGAQKFEPSPYDPQKAKDLLGQAGHAKGLEITLDVVPNIPAPIVSQAVAGYLEAVGIKTKLQNWDYSAWIAWLGAADKDRTNHLVVFPASNRMFPLSSIGGQFVTKARLAGFSFRSAKFDALYDEGVAAKDLSQIATVVGKIDQYKRDNWSAIELIQLGQYWVSSAKIDVTGWTAGGVAAGRGGIVDLAVAR